MSKPGHPKATSTSVEIGSGSEACVETNASLVRRILNQDSAAFATLVERYHGFVFGICFRILQHRQDAEDATQETFARVAKYLEKWDPRRPLEPWLATVAGNRSRSHLAGRSPHTPLAQISEPESRRGDHARQADAMREEIGLALKRLSNRQRTAFEMFHTQSMTYAEIAEAMDCPIGTAKVLVHRARNRMIDHLKRRDAIDSPSNQSISR
jgi:RNA polymerase sigma-70 factor (ECF subfamily)